MTQVQIKNEKIRAALKESREAAHERLKETVRQAQDDAIHADKTLERLAHLDLDWFGGLGKIYVRLDSRKSKADFSNVVETIALALDEAPSIRVEKMMFESAGEYIAEFDQSRVYVFAQNPSDCRLIEVEEPVAPRKVLKPHPACVHALKSLEDIA